MRSIFLILLLIQSLLYLFCIYCLVNMIKFIEIYLEKLINLQIRKMYGGDTITIPCRDGKIPQVMVVKYLEKGSEVK